MCINNINANIFLCKSAGIKSDLLSFAEIFDTFEGLKKDDGIYLPKCHIIVLLNALYSEKDNPLKKIFQCKLNLVSRSTGKATQLAEFEFNPQTEIKERQEHQCRSFSSQRFIVHVNELKLNSDKGNYLLKLWLKDIDEWKIQTMSVLTVN